MSQVRETSLPGFGIRYEFTSKDGHRLAVIHHRRGLRELYVFDAEDPDAVAVTIDLDAEDARTLGELLGTSRIVEQINDLRQQVEGLAVDWLTLGKGSPYAGASLGDAQIRTRTGCSVVAVIRGKEAFPAPTPQMPLEAGDTLLAVGTTDGLAEVDEILRSG